LTGLESVVLREDDHQPAEGCGADGYSGNGLDDVVTCGNMIFTDGRTTICCRNAATSGDVDVDSLRLMLSLEGRNGVNTCRSEGRFDVSAGDAQRSGYHEIYDLNEALLRELCCLSLGDTNSTRESPELGAFEEEWCFFEEEEIEDGIQQDGISYSTDQ